jgi:hypothetical protein
MIAIVNVSKGQLAGVQDYEVRINSAVITTFKHRREDGLGQCLLEAAKAVERAKWSQAAQMFRDIAIEGKK